MIDSMRKLEKAAVSCGVLPFFANSIEGFSVEEMAAPGALFGESVADYGCWSWKGPVIQEMTTVYGKFFNRKAGFVALDLLPDFLNYRRCAYPVEHGSQEEKILALIRQHEGLTSTRLRKLLDAGKKPKGSRGIPETGAAKPKRNSLEGPLQRLQMGGWILIADFEYKISARGERYGWGVALYSTPEIWLERGFGIPGRSPGESFARLVEGIMRRNPGIAPDLLIKLLR